MWFAKRKVPRRNTQSRTLLSRKKNFWKRSNKKSLFWSIIWYWLVSLFFFWVIVAYVVYQKYLTDLPDVTELENLEISQSSILYDREGGELYRFFEENRTYVYFDQISPHIINGLVAWEDQRFWENQWVDPLGLVRAVLQWVTWQRSSLWGTSTLTQQLVRNTIIDNRSSGESFSDGVARKIREIYLSYQITSRLSKEKIIELYLNKIWYWSNAYWIEQAAQTFFGKSAREVSILEASMLASLPKWPSYYSPYNNFWRLVGYPYIFRNTEWPDSTQRIATAWAQEENFDIFSQLPDFISQLEWERISDSRLLLCNLDRTIVDARFAIDSDGCSILQYSQLLSFLGSLRFVGEEMTLWYDIGRKDFILWRMLEDQYITFDEYKASILESFWFAFETYRDNINHPHFVFYVREYLEEKYGSEILERWWLRIYTTLDPKAQLKAEQIIKAQAAKNQTSQWVNNAALVTLDNTTGEIVAMVGGRDYFDEEIQWNVNMITSLIQPGSSFKPFVYALAIDKEVVGSKTPIYDVETTFPGGYTPKNFDGKFMWKMNISTALNYSRNTTAVKAYYLAGWESEILDFMEALWTTSLKQFKEDYKEKHGTEYSYGAPLSLGTWLMSPLELAHAYSTLWSLWVRRDISPILRIEDSYWLIIEELNSNNGTQAIDPATAYIINKILSDTSSRPAFWNNFLSLSGRPASAKTWTSSMQYTQWGRQIVLPRNLWTAWYTPQYTTVVWSGNTNWVAAFKSANGLEASWPIWKDFMEYLHQWEPSLDWKRPEWVREVNISEITGMLAPPGMDAGFIVRSIFKNVPQLTESGIWTREVDLLCNGKVTDDTPESAIWTIQVVLLRSLRPHDAAWERPVQEWIRQGWWSERLWNIWNFTTTLSEEICLRSGIASDIELWSTIQDWDILIAWSNQIEIWYRSANPLKYLRVYLDWERVLNREMWGESRGIYNWSIVVPRDMSWGVIMRIEAIDNEFFSRSVSYNVITWLRDTSPPEIEFTNPANWKISLYPWEFFNLRWVVRDQSRIRSINIYLNEERVRIWLSGNEFVQKITTDGLDIWTHIIRVEAVDGAFNTWSNTVELEVIPR